MKFKELYRTEAELGVQSTYAAGNLTLRLLSKKQAAAILGISTDTLMALSGKGDILGFKVGGQWRFDERDICNYIGKQRQRAIYRTVAAHTKTKAQRHTQATNGIVPTWAPGMKIQDVCTGKNN